MTLENRLQKWLEQPGAVVTIAERQFIEDMRKAAVSGVGYGWMQQVIEWEWQAVGEAAWGPEYFKKQLRELEQKLGQ